MGKGGHGGKQRDLCVALYHRLQTKKWVKLSEFAKDLEISYDTAFRWAESFSLIMDLRIERGIAILGEGEPDRPSARFSRDIAPGAGARKSSRLGTPAGAGSLPHLLHGKRHPQNC